MIYKYNRVGVNQSLIKHNYCIISKIHYFIKLLNHIIQNTGNKQM